MRPLALVFAAAACFGLLQHAAGLVAVWRFRSRPLPDEQLRCGRPAPLTRPLPPQAGGEENEERIAATESPSPACGEGGSDDAHTLPAITILKPLHGDEPLLEAALASFCAQDYPTFQIVFGVQDPADPALGIVAHLKKKFPDRDLAVVVDPTPHGTNGKIANLINMLPSARHDVLMIADADVHAAPDLLARVANALARPGVGLVTTLYSGRPAAPTLASRLGATQITHVFLPGVLLGRALGRQDCLGATMTLRRATLGAIGGFRVLADRLADDAVLGMLVRARGLRVALASAVPATTVIETTFRALLRHELRWARTMRSVTPAGYAASVLQYPIFWTGLAAASAGFTLWSVALFGAAWTLRAGIARDIDRTLGLTDGAPPGVGRGWLLPLRELISVVLVLASFAGNKVEWRGQTMRVDRARRGSPYWAGTERKRGVIAPS